MSEQILNPNPQNNQERPLVEVKNLKEYFNISTGFFKTTPLKAVDDVSFAIRRGETLGLVGESGCGKTTVGRTLLHLYKPTAGEIIYDGKSIVSRSDIAMLHKRTSMVFQDPYSSLNPRMTVADIIGEPLDVHKLCKTKNERRDRILELMGHVGLNSEHASRYSHEFSGGQRQRIGIARALAVNPEFIVCDEPVSALDVSIQAQVINMFDELQDKLGLTYLFIAHDLLVVRHISDRIAVMYLGKMVELADASEICDKPLHPYSKALMSAVPLPDPNAARANKRIPLSGDIPSPLHAPSGCPFRTRCPYATELCAEAMPEFKEVSKGHFVACHRTADINT
ncbi:MAG: ABC transporter ATP-binding protein [Clostridia bacterium]|nr:ABC transporter ATP-binding protein [Clostridia bacterium]